MSQCPSNYFFLYRDQVELADGDALVPVAHFSKEVRIILPEFNSEYNLPLIMFKRLSLIWMTSGLFYFRQPFPGTHATGVITHFHRKFSPLCLYLKCSSLLICVTCKSQGDTVGRVKERMQERLGVNDKVRTA